MRTFRWKDFWPSSYLACVCDLSLHQLDHTKCDFSPFSLTTCLANEFMLPEIFLIFVIDSTPFWESYLVKWNHFNLLSKRVHTHAYVQTYTWNSNRTSANKYRKKTLSYNTPDEERSIFEMFSPKFNENCHYYATSISERKCVYHFGVHWTWVTEYVLESALSSSSSSSLSVVMYFRFPL